MDNRYQDGDLTRLEVTVTEMHLQNGDVGSQWNNKYSVIYGGNKHYCAHGETISIPYRIGDEFELHSYVEEQDTISDIAYHSSYDTITAEDARGGDDRTWVHTLAVTEDNGPTSGSSAKWEIIFDLHIAPERTEELSSSPPPGFDQMYIAGTETVPTNNVSEGLFFGWVLFVLAALIVVARAITILGKIKNKRPRD